MPEGGLFFLAFPRVIDTLFETLVIPADLSTEINPQEFLRILMMFRCQPKFPADPHTVGTYADNYYCAAEFPAKLYITFPADFPPVLFKL